jgi:hypothetical protein
VARVSGAWHVSHRNVTRRTARLASLNWLSFSCPRLLESPRLLEDRRPLHYSIVFSAEPPSPFSRAPASAMSSAGSLRAGGSDRSGGCKRGHPLGSCNKGKSPAVVQLVPRKRGHPLGSHNKKTLAALTAAAAVTSSAKPPTAAVGGSSGAASSAARRPQLLPKKQPLAYTSVNGYTNFLVPLLDGSEDRLPCLSGSLRCWGADAHRRGGV